MCGIAGIISLIGDKQVRVKKMIDVLKHRGPDGEGVYNDDYSALGHRRLSILDLSSHGKQPMIYNDYIIVFNGEIYNYKEIRKDLENQGLHFVSDTDTEVLLKAFSVYGYDVLALLDGMFAFAIWNKKEKKLFCARDRFGEKPFFYYLGEDDFVFASEIKALFAGGVERNVDYEMIFMYLYYDYVANPNKRNNTFYHNINSLAPAEAMVYSPLTKELKKWKYWELVQGSQESANKKDVYAKFYDLFKISVGRRLIADVEVGSSLSGGLDSSSVVAEIFNKKNDKGKQKTFTARFLDKELDEGYYVNKVVDKFNLDNYQTWVTGNNLIDRIKNVFYYQDEPFGSASIIAQWEVMKLASEHGVKVLLDGQGADEILAGYHHYYKIFLKNLFVKDREKYASELLKIKAINPNISLSGIDKFYAAYPRMVNVLKNIKNKMFPEYFGLNRNFWKAYFNDSTSIKTDEYLSLNEKLLFDTTVYGLEKLLRFADRNSMANSVEVRLPFLYYKLVEFVFSLPDNFKINDGWTKFLLRKSFENILPEEIVWRKDKKGFKPPQEDWLNDDKVVDCVNYYKEKLIRLGIITNKYSLKWNILMVGELLRL